MRKIKQKRFIWVDVMRTIAIFFVISVHTSSLPTHMNDIRSFLPFLVSFSLIKVCVPLFVMLSGAMLLGKNESITTFFTKRAVKVLIPWILWTLIYMVWNYYFHAYHPSDFSQWKYFFEVTFFSQLWFLPLIFSLYLLTPILRLLVPQMKKSHKIYFAAIWVFFVVLIPFFHTGTTFPRADNSGLVPVAIYYSGYFMIGYFLNEIKLPKNSVRRSLGLILIGLAITFMELGISKGNLIFDYFAPGVVVTSIGVYLFILTSFRGYSSKERWGKLITSIGNASLGIYIMHGLIADVLSPTFPQLGKTGYFYTAILFGISYICVLVLKKIPALRILVP